MEMEYTGAAPRPVAWPGEVTGCRYLFGGQRRVGLADTRDALRWLAQRGDKVWRVRRDSTE